MFISIQIFKLYTWVSISSVKHLGLFTFAVATPLCYAKSIEKFAITYLFADILIFITAIVIIVYVT